MGAKAGAPKSRVLVLVAVSGGGIRAAAWAFAILRELVEDSVAKLPAHHREVFVLRELEGKSYEEIAEITHTNLGTVKSRLNRARNSFADLIEPKLR